MTEQTKTDAVIVAREGAVMIVTLNRPEARNAVNLAVHRGLGRALEQAEDDPGIRAVVLTGAGDQAFCAGADLKALARGEPMQPDDSVERAWGFAGIVSHPIGKPIVAAVNGFALGGGTEIALSCDLVVAAETASFGLPEVKRGIIAGAGGAFRIADHLPRKVALEFLLTGDPISAETALRWGLVNAVVAQDRVIKAALALAQRIAANAPLAVQASKRIANRIADGRIAREAESWAITGREIEIVMNSEDRHEGVRAFVEKRAPDWKGR